MGNEMNNIAKRLKERGIEFPGVEITNVEFSRNNKTGFAKVSFKIKDKKKAKVK